MNFKTLSKNMHQFKQRLAVGILGILGLTLSIYYSHTLLFKPIFILLNTSLICLALIEYYHLAQHKNFQPLTKLGLGTTVAYITALSFGFYGYRLAELPSLILLIFFLLFFLKHFNQQSSALGNLAVSSFGIIYLTIPLSCGMQINYLENGGQLWLAYVLLVSKTTDIGAYFCGKFLGKRKLAPTISPKKTIEGAIGGIGFAVLASIIFSIFTLKLTILQSIWMGLLMSILAQLGDLAESLIKRDAGVKDSSRLPGLGGFLDIVDSLVFTLPLMYLLLKIDKNLFY